MKKSGGPLRCGRSIFTVPGIQTDMVVITSGRNKNGIFAIPLHDLEPEQFLVKFERPGDVSHFEVNMTNSGGGGYSIVQRINLLGIHQLTPGVHRLPELFYAIIGQVFIKGRQAVNRSRRGDFQ